MKKGYVKAIDGAKERGLFLKVVTSMKSFETYNAFYNIFGDSEEACRRVVVITPYEELEEVNDENPGEEISDARVIDGNLWLKTFPLITSPSKINLDEFEVLEELLDEIKR
ncbi:MAG: hypothetical protein ACRC7N_02040 [Clostridium sp.]